MAHRKAGGSTTLGRDSISKRLGLKLFGGQTVKAGNIIVRQRGKKYREGENVKRGSDDTLYALTDGVIKFQKKKIIKYDGRLQKATFVSVVKETSDKKTKTKK